MLYSNNQKYGLLPFTYERFENTILLVNLLGEYIFLRDNEFNSLIKYELNHNSDTYYDLKSKFFIYNVENKNSVINLMASRYRTKKRFIEDFTVLHMIVPTLNCNSNCEYCQVSSTENNSNKFMTYRTAKKVIEKIFSCPSKNIKIEFQGGEPLLNLVHDNLT